MRQRRRAEGPVTRDQRPAEGPVTRDQRPAEGPVTRDQRPAEGPVTRDQRPTDGPVSRAHRSADGLATPAQAKLWLQKWRWYERNSLPWNRVRIHYEFMRREAFVRWPVHGNVLEAFREGRLEVGAHTLLEPHVWLTAPGRARIRIGWGTFLNIAVMVASLELVEIGDHCMFANGCFVTDSSHRFDDPHRPVPWQGFTSKGPTRIGDNVWCGANVVITSGVTIGERCVIGADSVVTADIPPFSIAAGAPARVLREIRYEAGAPPGADAPPA